MKGGLAKQRFRDRQRRNRIIGQLEELHAADFSADEIRAAGPNAYASLMFEQPARPATNQPSTQPTTTPTYTPPTQQPGAQNYSFTTPPAATTPNTPTATKPTTPAQTQAGPPAWVSIFAPSAVPAWYTSKQAPPASYNSYAGEPWYFKYPMRVAETALKPPTDLLSWIARAAGAKNVTPSPTFKQIWNIK